MTFISRNRLRRDGRHPIDRDAPSRRDAAQGRPLTEAEIVARRCGSDVVRLKPAWPELFSRVRALGPVVALTRNAGAAVAKTGVYALPAFESAFIGRVVGSVDLRLFTQHWGDAFLFAGAQGSRARRGVCIFDRHGNAVHEILLHPESSPSAWAELAWNLHAEDQSAAFSAEPVSSPSFARRVDVAGLRDAVRTMSRTHEFGGVLQQYNVAREHALRLIGGEYAWRVDRTSIRGVLRASAASGRALTCFVENAGMLHIHSAPIERVVQAAECVSVMDPGFTFHFNERLAANVWVLRKPTRSGFVTSVEAYDRRGSLLVQLFSPPDVGGEENEHWRALTASLPRAADLR